MALLRSKQLLALNLFLQGLTKTDICRKLGTRPQTLERWAKLEAWQRELAEARKDFGLTHEQIRLRAQRKLLLKAEPAIETIDQLRQTATNERNQLSAATFIVKASGVAALPQTALASPIDLTILMRALEGLAKEPRRVRNITPGNSGAPQGLEHAPVS